MTLAAAAVTAYNNAAASAAIAGLTNGTVEILDAGGVVLASASLGTPTASGAVTTMGGFPKTAAAVAVGTAASARYRTSAAADWKTGMSVGLADSGANVIMSTLSIESVGQSVQFSSATLTHNGTAA
jgi:hypothetical protein